MGDQASGWELVRERPTDEGSQDGGDADESRGEHGQGAESFCNLSAYWSTTWSG